MTHAEGAGLRPPIAQERVTHGPDGLDFGTDVMAVPFAVVREKRLGSPDAKPKR